MILSKKFDCTAKDLDSVVVALAKEIDDGWNIYKIETHPFEMSYMQIDNKPTFTVELCRKGRY